MLLPIYAYGQAVLKKVATEIGPDYPDLTELIANMWETMYHADGVGLAAPQIGRSIRLFVADTAQVDRDEDAPDTDQGFKRIFINPQMIVEDGEPWAYEEGCLSIPEIRGEVVRNERIHLRWKDEYFQEQEAIFTGINARVIQHEYDHLQGVLFVEKLKPLKRRMIQRRLDAIREGKIKASYKLKFAPLR
jgi:peptide deformylase